MGEGRVFCYHAIYHSELEAYLLGKNRELAKSFRRRKVNAAICEFADSEKLTREMLAACIDRIEIGHLSAKGPLRDAVTIYWRLG